MSFQRYYDPATVSNINNTILFPKVYFYLAFWVSLFVFKSYLKVYHSDYLSFGVSDSLQKDCTSKAVAVMFKVDLRFTDVSGELRKAGLCSVREI